MDVLRGKWLVVLLARLKVREQRYSELRSVVPLSDKMLTQRLHDLVERGLADKDADGRYRLTSIGQSLRPVLEAMYQWGEGEAVRRGIVFEPMP